MHRCGYMLLLDCGVLWLLIVTKVSVMVYAFDAQ